jgi:hypothetical protein
MKPLRDYIGSADALSIYRKNYHGLIKSKLRDSGYTNLRMSQGLELEAEVAAELVDFGYLEEPIDHQCKLRHDELEYCQASADLVSGNKLVEVKSTKLEIATTVEQLMRIKAEYFYQVQWQLWLADNAGFELEAAIAWCKTADDDGFLANEFDGQLVNHLLELKADEEVWKQFYENAIEFWHYWTEYKSCYDEHFENCIDLQKVELLVFEMTNIKQRWKEEEKQRKAGKK